MRLGLAGKLDGDLALEDDESVELGDGTVGFRRGRQIDKGVTHGALGARVGRDGHGLAAAVRQSTPKTKRTYTRKSLKKIFNSSSVVA